MRVVKYVFIHPTVGLWGEFKNKRIRDEERSISFFLGSFIKESKLSYEEFDGIFFQGSDIYEQPIFVKNRLLVVPIPMFEKSYPDEIDRISINNYLISCLYIGIRKMKQDYNPLTSLLIAGIENFKKNEYVCKWIHKKKKLGGFLVELRCYLDVSEFKLSLVVCSLDLRVLFDREILKTSPNEYSFKHRFKDIIVDDGKLHVTDSFNNSWFELDISKLIKNTP